MRSAISTATAGRPATGKRDFRSYGNLVTNVGPNNGLKQKSNLAFAASDVIGFRAPYLAKGAGLYAALKANGFRYDTSGVGQGDASPGKDRRHLAIQPRHAGIAGSGKGTLLMDYNFFVAHSGAVDKQRRYYELAREQMLQTCSRLPSKRTTPATARRCISGITFRTIRAAPTTRRSNRSRARFVAPPARSALRDLRQARRLHGWAETGSAMLAAYRKGDFARAGDPGVERGGACWRKRTGRCDGCPVAAACKGGRLRLAFNIRDDADRDGPVAEFAAVFRQFPWTKG